MGRFRRRLGLWLWGPRVEEGVDWEIRHHLEERADELEATGLSREEALAAARRAFGNVAAIRRELRSLDRGAERRRRVSLFLETVRRDVAYGFRGVFRNPGFSLALVLTLGLGVGATTAVFGVVDALLLRPLPYAESSELARVEVVRPAQTWGQRIIPAGVARGWEADDVVFEHVLLNHRETVLFTGGAEPRMVAVQVVSPSFEETLGVRPVIGRGIAPEDAAPGAERVALLDHAFWRGELGGDPDVVGRTIELDDLAHTVIGVMPRGFKFPEYATTAAWVPLARDGSALGGDPGSARALEIIGRVPGGRFEAARARAGTLATRLLDEGPAAGGSFLLAPLEAARGGGETTRQAVWLLFGGVILILLVAAVNGANLLLVRGLGRTREVAVRVAMGASRLRLVRQLLTESVLLSLLSAVAAAAVAYVALASIRGILPGAITFYAPHELAVTRRTLVFAFCIATGAGLLLALLPAFRTTTAARASARGGFTPYASGTPSRSRLRRGLVVVEVALSVMLLAGAGLFLNSFVRMMRVDPGLRLENMALLNLSLSPRALGDEGGRAEFLPRLEERIEAIPGVTGAAVTGGLPAGGLHFGLALEAEGREPRPGSGPDILPSIEIGPDFFEITGARLLAGRPFTAHEAELAAIVDEDLARHLWPGEAPVGRRFRTAPDAPWRTVVGVVGDLRLLGPDTERGDFEILYPLDARDPGPHQFVTIAIRTDGDPRPLFPAVRAAVHEVAPRQPIQELAPAGSVFARAVDLPRFLTVLMSALAAFALFLAAIGLYGLLAHGVASRAREIGVRMAMGAHAADIRRMVVTEGAALALGGATLGLIGAVALSRFIVSMLFGIRPTDPATLAAVVLALLAAAFAASYAPARRATRLDPAETLRLE